MAPEEMVAGWVRKLRRGKKGGGRMQAKCLTKCPSEESSTSSGSMQEDEAPKAVGRLQEGITSFKLAAGLGLAFVVVASKNALDKMMELWKQMVIIVENAKEELGGKAAVCNKSRSSDNKTCSTNNVEECMNSNGQCFRSKFHGKMRISRDGSA